jgi:hypothetical protein
MQQKVRRLVLTRLDQLCRVALRVMAGGLIFMACLTVMSRYLGLPVPDPLELLDKFKDVARLAEILS